MFFGGRRQAATGAARPSAFDQLLSTEEEIALHLAAADRDCAALTAVARDDAAQIAREAATKLTAELAALDARDAAARAGLTRALEENAARVIAHYESLDEGESARLAAFVVMEITGLTLATTR